MTNFLDISYLAEGNPRQRKCFGILRQAGVMEILAPYGPILTGTIPIETDIPSSDLDIVCEVHDPEEFAATLRKNFGSYDRFSLRGSGGTVVCGFFTGGEEIEIFGSPVHSVRSNAYRHMIVEHRLLTILGGDFRRQVVELKLGGLKTEPAFARLLGLPGDPYEALLELETMTDERLAGFRTHVN